MSMHVTRQTLVIWSASGRTLGVTLSNIFTCSRTSSGILLSSAGLMLLSYNQNRLKSSSRKKSVFDICKIWHIIYFLLRL